MPGCYEIPIKRHRYNEAIFTFWVPCCAVRFDFHIKTMFGLSLPPFVCRRAHMSYLRYVCLFAYCGVQNILRCVFVLFVFVLCALCFRFLWIVHFWLSLRYSLTFIYIVCCIRTASDEERGELCCAEIWVWKTKI
jgi:hypothetical protein